MLFVLAPLSLLGLNSHVELCEVRWDCVELRGVKLSSLSISKE